MEFSSPAAYYIQPSLSPRVQSNVGADSIMCVATARDTKVMVQRGVDVSIVEVRDYNTNISGAATDGTLNFMITTSR